MLRIDIGKEHVVPPGERAEFVFQSIKYTHCLFCAANGETSDDMVQCDVCEKWYHTTCIGVDVGHFSDTRFSCCQEAQDQSFEYV